MLSSLSDWLLMAPILVIILVIFGGMVLAAYIGRFLRRRHDAAKTAEAPEEGGKDSFLLTSVMGLLALLVGFTFSLAIDRFDARRQTVLEESNAIGTAYLRTQLLEAPHRARISQMLTEYTDTRLALAVAGPGPKQVPLLEKSDHLIADLWTATVAAFPTVRSYDFSSAYLDSMNALIDMDASRKASRQAHVPSEVFLVLLLYQFIAAGVISYILVGRNGRQTAVFLFLLFGIALLLVIDIDRPTSGGITESQEPMLQLRAFMKAQPPESFDRLTAPAQVPLEAR